MQPAPEWQTVEVTGSLNRIAFPAMCFRCGAASQRKLRIDRLFEWAEDESENGWQILSVNAPVCRPCFERHQTEFRYIPLDKRILPALKTEVTIPFVCSALATLYFLKEFFERRSAALAIPVVLFGIIATLSAFAILRRSRKFGVSPDTGVTSWIVFGRDRRKLFEPEHRKFQFRNAAFAAAFREANQDKLWSGKSEWALNAGLARHLLLWTSICVGAALVLWEVIQDYWPR